MLCLLEASHQGQQGRGDHTVHEDQEAGTRGNLPEAAPRDGQVLLPGSSLPPGEVVARGYTTRALSHPPTG